MQRCVYKAYIKWLGMLLPGCGADGRVGDDLELLQEDPGNVGL